MFGNKERYESDIRLGEKYRDTDTGFEGTATAVIFFQHGCERVDLKALDNDGKLVAFTFDAPELESVQTQEKVTSAKTGGARPSPTNRRNP